MFQLKTMVGMNGTTAMLGNRVDNYCPLHVEHYYRDGAHGPHQPTLLALSAFYRDKGLGVAQLS